MKIVLTGGPGAGKTAMLELLSQEFAAQVRPVKEAASLLFHGGFPRSGDREHRKCQERAIFRVQRELERIGELEAEGRALLCDRGSLDGVAYWPDQPDSFFKELGTTEAEELGRYDWVIHLHTIANTPPSWLRCESDAQARTIDESLKVAWKKHPRRFVIGTSQDYARTMKEAAVIIQKILAGDSYESITTALSLPANEMRASEPTSSLH
jgi:hypothetical protein